MPWIRTIAHEVYGLFVDDGSLAVAVLAWVAVVWLVLPHVLPSPYAAVVFGAGLALILVENLLRASRRGGC